MIVDDHQGIRLILKKHLELAISEPYEVIECESGEEAVEGYVLHHPDCVLMDIELKQINGLQASEIILDHDPKAKIIIVTSHEISFMRKKAGELPIVDFVSKEHLSKLAPILKALLNI